MQPLWNAISATRKYIEGTGSASSQWIRQDPHEVYTFGPQLGRGQFGVIYLITSKADPSQSYACKVLSKSKPGFSLSGVSDEVKALQQVSGHPNIVTLYQVYEDDRYIYLLMEACMGGELFDLIIKRGHFSEQDAANVARVVLEVVQHCHERGVVHRDLKPENFLLKRRVKNVDQALRADNLRAADFGLAAFTQQGQKPRFTSLVGSAFYVSPDVLKGNYGAEADLWSAGVILYILLSGLPPFYGRSEHEIFAAVRRGNPEYESSGWQTVSPDAKDLVQRLLQVDRTKRLTAKQALEHPWLTRPIRPASPQGPSSRQLVQRLRDFTRMTRLQGLLLNVVAHRLSGAEVACLRETFQRLDTDGNGTISLDELREGLAEVTGNLQEPLDPHIAEELMLALDVSGDGQIDHNEFIAACADHYQLLTDHTLSAIFGYMDRNGDGWISASELSEALQDNGISVDAATIAALIAADFKGAPGSEPQISAAAFKEAMKGGLRQESMRLAQLDSALGSMRRKDMMRARFRQLVGIVVARALPARHASLRPLFDFLDTDHSGSLTLQELREGLLDGQLQLNEGEVEELMKFMDVDRSGSVKYEEFVVGMLEEVELLSATKLHVAFDYLDKDHNGLVDVDEFQEAILGMGLRVDARETLAGEFSSSKGGLDYDAFERVMLSAEPEPIAQLSSASMQDAPLSIAPPEPLTGGDSAAGDSHMEYTSAAGPRRRSQPAGSSSPFELQQAQAPSTSEAHPATRSSAAHPHSDSSTSGPDRSTRSSRQGSTASSSVGSTLFDRTSANVGLTLRASQVLQRHYQATLASSTVTEAADETGSASTAATVAGEHGSSSGASKPSEAHGEAAATAERPGSAARHSHISGDEAGAEEGRRGWDTVAESAAHTTGDAGLRQLGSLPEVDDALPEAAESGRSAGAAGGQAEPRSGVVVRAGKSIGRTQGVQGERGSDLLAAMDDLWLGQGQKADPYTRSTVG